MPKYNNNSKIYLVVAVIIVVYKDFSFVLMLADFQYKKYHKCPGQMGKTFSTS